MEVAKIKIVDYCGNNTTETFCKVLQWDSIKRVQYQENEKSGLGNTKTIIEFNDKIAHLTRVGEVCMTMTFSKEENCTFPITTKYGEFCGQLTTTLYRVIEKENMTALRINYNLSLSKELVEEHKLKIEINRKEN